MPARLYRVGACTGYAVWTVDAAGQKVRFFHTGSRKGPALTVLRAHNRRLEKVTPPSTLTRKEI